MNNQIQDLIIEISNGKEHAFEEIYKLYFSNCYNTALYITKSKYLAEETVSDVFADIWKNRKKLTGIKNWESYLYIVIRNKSFYYRSKCKTTHLESLDDLPYTVSFSEVKTPLSELQFKEISEKLKEEFNALPEKMKLIFYLVKHKEKSHKELAKQFNLSERTINAHITEATKRLREAMHKYLSNEE